MKGWRVVNSLLVFALIAGTGGGCTKQMRKARHLSRGDKDFAAERYDEAEIEFLKVLQMPPPEPHALTRLGVICYDQGRWANAAYYMNKALELQPTNSEARVKLGLADLLFQQTPAARGQALKVLTNEPDNSEALLLLVGASYSTQQLAEAAQALGKVSAAGHNRAGYHLALGALYLHQKDFTNAEAEYRQELAVDPKSSQAYLALGNLFLLRQDIKQAEPALKSAAELAPLRSGARLNYAGLKLQTGDATNAVKEIQDLVKKAPDFLPAWLFLAQATSAQGKPDECATALQRILTRDPINIEGLTLNGSLLLAKGDGTNAAAMFERIIKVYPPGPARTHYGLALAQSMNGDFNKAVASVNRALALQTNYPQATLLLAKLNLRQGDSASAIAVLTRLVQQQPFLADGYSQLANVYLGQKRYEEAAAVYRRMMLVFTNTAEVPFNLGSVLLAQNKTDEARQAFDKSLANSPGFLPSIEQLVELDLKRDQPAAAIERVSLLVDQYPKAAALQLLLARIHTSVANATVAKENQKNPAGPHLGLGDVPAAAEDLKQAEAALLKAIELSPDSTIPYQLLAALYANSNRQQQALDRLNGLLARTNDLASLMEVAVIQERMTNYNGARDTYEKILKTNPNAVATLNNLAVLYSERLGQLDRGFQLAEKARQLQPDNAYVADTFGWMLFQRGDYARAVSLIDEAASRLPDLSDVQYHLGLAHYMLGEELSARAALQRATQAGNTFDGAKEAGEALRILAIEPDTANEGDRALLDQRLRQTPSDSVALVRLAAIQERDHQISQALESCERASKVSPKNPQILFRLARLYSMTGDPRAMDTASSAHALAPDDANISSLLGWLAYQNGNYPWAASLLEESGRRLPDDPEVSYRLAWCEYSIGRTTNALVAMQAVVRAGDASTNRADAAQFVDMVAAADDPSQVKSRAAAAEKLLGSNPTFVPALMVCAEAAELNGEFKQAGQLYDRALARFPQFAPAMRKLALLSFSQLQDDQRAYELATKAREAYPDDAQLTRVLGIIAYRRGDYTRCAQWLSSSSRDGKPDAELLCYLGLAEYKLKDTARSKATLKQVSTNNIPPRLAADVQKALAEFK